MTSVRYRTADVDGLRIFYREAGAASAPKLLLLHGFPSASHMFRDLIPLLADRFHVVAPDLPGFGQSDMPAARQFAYTFDNISRTSSSRFTEIIGFDRYAIYVFDYGAPTGFRLAVAHPERITAIISQNGNAYEEGLSEGWNPIRAYWQDPSQANREALRAFLTPETTRWQYTHGVPDATRYLRTDIRSTISIWPVQAPTTCSSTCSATTRATSRCIRNSRNTSGPTSRRSWRCGARTIRSSCRPAPRRSSATSRSATCASSTPATSRWKRMLATKSPRQSVVSSVIANRRFAASAKVNRCRPETKHPHVPPRLAASATTLTPADNPIGGPDMPLPLIVFDVNETLLDLETMEPTSSASSATRAPCGCGSRTYPVFGRH